MAIISSRLNNIRSPLNPTNPAIMKTSRLQRRVKTTRLKTDGAASGIGPSIMMRGRRAETGGKASVERRVALLSRAQKVVDDRRAEFKALTAKTPIDREFRAAFIENKLRILHTHPGFTIGRRNRAVAQTARILGTDSSSFLTQPIPGGVGYGMFYTTSFKQAWGIGTSLACYFICPTVPGGNVNTWLYITAMNRAGKGIEAFVAYNSQAEPHFRIFDWARADQWQTDLPFTNLADYLTSMPAHGYQYQILPVWNSTWRLSDSTYRNQALLYNHVRGGWDLIYQFDYTATDADQKNGWAGSWSPIVETFQSSYDHTNQMGVLATQLIGADNNGNWGTWGLLGPTNSNLRTDNVGFQQMFLDPNYGFAVNS